MAKKKKDEATTDEAGVVVVTRSVMRDISLEDISRLAHEMADTMTAKFNLEQELKNVSKEFKDRITAEETKLQALKDQIDAGQHKVKIECKVVKNFDRTMVEFWSIADNELVDEQPMTAEDHQTDLEFAEQANAEEDKRIEAEEQNSEGATEAETIAPVLTKQEKERFRELFNAANTATKERRFDDAVALFDDALLIKPTDAKAIEKRKQLLPFLTAANS